jgi:CBS domain-containing protein
VTVVKQMLLEKGPDVWTVTPETSLHETLRVMADKGIGAVLVVSGEKIEGIFSERDFSREFAKDQIYSLDTPIKKMMTRLVYYVPPDLSIEECMALMSDKKIRHLPVVDDGKLVGIISIGDVVREVISQKEVAIRSLENYIMGRGYQG